VAFIWEKTALLVEAIHSKMCYYVCKVTLREYHICMWFKELDSGYIDPQLCIICVTFEYVNIQNSCYSALCSQVTSLLGFLGMHNYDILVKVKLALSLTN
jgi:hypothetical protein